MSKTAHFVICPVAGILLALLPHLMMLYKTGAPYYVADHDDFLYLSVAGQSYNDHPFSLADPMFESGNGKSVYPYLQFASGILPARFLMGSPLWINFFWRLFAGMSIGLAWALLLNELVEWRALATASVIVLLSDIGLASGHLFIKPALTFVRLILGQDGALFATNPQLLVQWRIISPGLSLAYLLLHVWAMVRLRKDPGKLRIVFAGFTFGLLFYVYFYYWTAAALSLALSFLIDSEKRKAYLWTGILGAAIGARALWDGLQLKSAGSDQWQQRTDNFLPIPHFSELLLPALAIAVLLVSFFWIYFRRRQHLPFWTLAASGLMLANHQIISGLQIQNFHYVFVWGPMTSLVIVLALIEASERFYARSPKAAQMTIVLVAAISFSAAIWLRGLETARSEETVGIQKTLAGYVNQRRESTFVRGSVIGGAADFVEPAIAFENVRPLEAYAALFSPAINNDELAARLALNAYLMGTTFEQFDKEQREALAHGVWGPAARNFTERDRTLKSRMKAFDEVSRDALVAVRRFGLSYVALLPEQHLPEAVRSDFRVLQNGPRWIIWERTDLTVNR